MLTFIPSLPLRQQAGLNAADVKMATVVSWMYCGSFFTRELLYKMKKAKTSACHCDDKTSENLPHFLLHCPLYEIIRQQYIPSYFQMNNEIPAILDDEKLLVISILDPLSAKLPEIITRKWSSIKDVYKLSRTF